MNRPEPPRLYTAATAGFIMLMLVLAYFNAVDDTDPLWFRLILVALNLAAVAISMAALRLRWLRFFREQERWRSLHG